MGTFGLLCGGIFALVFCLAVLWVVVLAAGWIRSDLKDDLEKIRVLHARLKGGDHVG